LSARTVGILAEQVTNTVNNNVRAIGWLQWSWPWPVGRCSDVIAWLRLSVCVW